MAKQLSSTDLQLINQLLQGGSVARKAINSVYERYVYLVKLGMKKYPIQEEQARSAYNQSILVFFQHVQANKFRQDSSIKTYIHQIFFRQCVNEIRKEATQKKQDWTTLLPNYPQKAKSLLEEIILQEEIADLKAMMARLDERCREILQDWAYFGYSMAEIAKKMGLKNAETAAVQKSRCKKKLIKLMNKNTKGNE